MLAELVERSQEREHFLVEYKKIRIVFEEFLSSKAEKRKNSFSHVLHDSFSVPRTYLVRNETFESQGSTFKVSVRTGMREIAHSKEASMVKSSGMTIVLTHDDIQQKIELPTPNEALAYYEDEYEETLQRLDEIANIVSYLSKKN